MRYGGFFPSRTRHIKDTANCFFKMVSTGLKASIHFPPFITYHHWCNAGLCHSCIVHFVNVANYTVELILSKENYLQTTRLLLHVKQVSEVCLQTSNFIDKKNMNSWKTVRQTSIQKTIIIWSNVLSSYFYVSLNLEAVPTDWILN